MKRGKSIKLALYAAVASKVTSAVLQLISLPLAARELGKAEFGVYSTVALSILFLTVLQLGVGPALSRLIAEASARKDHEQEKHYYQHGAMMVIALSVGFGGLLALGAAVLPLDLIYGAEFKGWEAKLRPALLWGFALLACEMLMWHTDRVREGYMEAFLMSSFACVGNLIGAITVIVGIKWFPSIPFLLMATILPNILVRLISTFCLWKKRSYLVSGLSKFRFETIKELFHDGISFSLTTQLVFFIEVFVCGYLVARWEGPSEAATYQVFVSITTVFNGMLLMVGRPYWAASINAKESKDYRWIKQAAYRFVIFYFGLAILATIGLVGFGPFLIKSLYGDAFDLPRSLFACHVVFLILFGWRDVIRSILIGQGFLTNTVKSIVTGVAISLPMALFGLSRFGLEAMFIGLAVGIAMSPGWQLPRMALRELNRTDNFDSFPVPETNPATGKV